MFVFLFGDQEHSILEHIYVDSGTTNIFDDVDKNDFKTDFGSEFPVGLNSLFLKNNTFFIFF